MGYLHEICIPTVNLDAGFQLKWTISYKITNITNLLIYVISFQSCDWIDHDSSCRGILT